jgi:sortase A
MRAGTGKRRWALWVALPLVAGGGLLFGQGVYIQAKASVAQALLELAWMRTLTGQEEVRPWPWADTWPVARLTIAERGVDVIVLNGAHGEALAFGPGLLPGSAGLGRAGPAIIAAHRDTHFAGLSGVEPGDTIEVQDASGAVHHYHVSGHAVVDHRNATIPAIDGTSTLTLVTCYPFDTMVPSGPERYLVHAVAE